MADKVVKIQCHYFRIMFPQRSHIPSDHDSAYAKINSNFM